MYARPDPWFQRPVTITPAVGAMPPTPILDSPRLSRVTLGLAWPVILSRTLHTLFHLANVAWVGRLGPEAIGAVTTGIYLFWTWYALAQMIALGATSVVANRIMPELRADRVAIRCNIYTLLT